MQKHSKVMRNDIKGNSGKILSVFILLVVTLGCKNREAKTSNQELTTTEVTDSRSSFFERLSRSKNGGILFGHQDDLAYGIGWEYKEGESDVKRVAGDYPSLFGWELGGLEKGDAYNLDSVPFDEMRRLAIKAHVMGGINTFSWHPYSAVNGESAWDKEAVVVKHIIPGGVHHEAFKKQLDQVAVFFKSIRDDHGMQVPFIFRPWHEMDGDWFWWGQGRCTSQEFKTLFRFTVTYLRDEKGLSDMLIAYSPDRNFNSKETYYQWYPGDDYVDILGVDNYYDLAQENGAQEAIDKLHLVIEEAKSKNKLAAFTETGLENVTDPTWYTEKLGKVLNDEIVARELSYVMVWRNDQKVHFFFPYPGHPAAENAKSLLSEPNIWLLKDFNGLK